MGSRGLLVRPVAAMKSYVVARTKLSVSDLNHFPHSTWYPLTKSAPPLFIERARSGEGVHPSGFRSKWNPLQPLFLPSARQMMTPDGKTVAESCPRSHPSQNRALRRSSLQKYLMIAIGGALGSIARYLVGSAVANRMGVRFPYGTFVINLTACVIIGFSLTLMSRRTEMNPAWRFLIPIGFVGAYSTFSTFEWETFTSLQTGAYLIAVLYVTLSCLLGLLAVWAGVLLARLAF